MRKSRVSWMIASSMLLTSCATLPRPADPPKLPDPPSEFGKAVDLPKPIKGKSIRTFALENRLGLITANKRLENDRAFYEDVREGFSDVR